MIFTASDFHTYYQPKACDLRVYLKHTGESEAPASPYADVLKNLGIRHEKNHLNSFPQSLDLRSVANREQRTIDAIRAQTPVIYQPRFKASFRVNDTDVEIIGEPDYLIFESNGYVIRDSKMAKRITEEDHSEIVFQLQLYGWLYEQNLKTSPIRIEVHSGTNEIVSIPYDSSQALQEIRKIISIRTTPHEPYSPVGWSKCSGCGFSDRCWQKAKSDNDVALLVAVDQNLTAALRENGVKTVNDLIAIFNVPTLSELKKPWGKKTQKVGKRAEEILRNAQAHATGKEIVFGSPGIPKHPNYVMFDLEGMPPQLNDLGKIYLWGMQVYGKDSEEFQPALAGFGEHGDKDGWDAFLNGANTIFKKHGDIPFVHWASYEKTHVDEYVERHGDPNGIAQRVKNNLLDLLPITRKSIALPLPSYSLKVIEPYVGFKRTQEEYGGQWSMAKYIEATETENPELRDEVMKEILIYNKEDLASMWAIFEWLRSKNP